MTSRVLVVGSVNVDVVLRLPRLADAGETVLAEEVLRGFGGKGANQAVAAATAGADVSLLGRVGADAAGSAYRERLAAFGVDVTLLLATPGQRTGTAYVMVDRAGENSIVVDAGANAAVGVDDLGPLDRLRPGDVLLTQCELPSDVVAAAVRTGHEAGATVVLNLAPYIVLPADVLSLCAAVVVNEAEAAELGAGLPPDSLVVTRGAAGAVWGDVAQPAIDVPAGEVVDTTGAGDAFCGALAAALASGLGRGPTLALAVAAGAAAVRRVGAQPAGD
jgi:ribokinase